MITLIKNLIKKLPFDLSKNHSYDRQTIAVIKKVCLSDSNCVDIGCHKGEVLDIILKYAPKGIHLGFEPIPFMYKNLMRKYANTKCEIYDIALSNKKGTSTFNFVVSNPAYSGLIKRNYDRPNEKDKEIIVQTNKLDNVLGKEIEIDFIKIDVEGGELIVLEGAIETIKRNRPIVVFEHGLGASEFYDSKPDKIYSLFTLVDYNVSLMKRWLNNESPFSLSEFEEQFHSQLNYYFIAYPK